MTRLLFLILVSVLMSGCGGGFRTPSPYEETYRGNYTGIEGYVAAGYFNDANAKPNTDRYAVYPGLTLCNVISSGNRRLTEMILSQRSHASSFDSIGHSYKMEGSGYRHFFISQLGCSKSIAMYNYLKSQGFSEYSNAIITSAIEGESVAIPWLLAEIKKKEMDADQLDISLEHAVGIHKVAAHWVEYFSSSPVDPLNAAQLSGDSENSLKVIETLLRLGANSSARHLPRTYPYYKDEGRKWGIKILPQLQAVFDKHRQDKLLKNRCIDDDEKTACKKYLRISKNEFGIDEVKGKLAEEEKLRLTQKEEAAQKKSCFQSNDRISCRAYLQMSSDQAGIKLARQKITQIVQKEKAARKVRVRLATLKKNQACKLKEGKWLYSSKTCKNNLAQGKGIAFHLNGQLKFEGTFKKGLRVIGLLSYNNAPMYDGPIAAGKPDGMGICFHQGEPEECKYYKGKRVDVIYKQRLALLAQERMMDEKIKQMADQQKQQLEAMQDKIDSVKSASASSSAQGGDKGATTLGGAVAGAVGDVLMDKAADKAADIAVDFLFDALF